MTKRPKAPESISAKLLSGLLPPRPKPLQGFKMDSGKVPWHLLPWDALEAVAKVLAFGVQKGYPPRNWEQGMEWTRVIRANINHAQEFLRGRDLDEESQLPVMAHAACEALFALAYQIRKVGTDDRPKEKRWTKRPKPSQPTASPQRRG